MPSTFYRADPELLVYYGTGQVPRLLRHRRVALQPDHYSGEDLAYLADNGVRALAYLALGEDTGGPAPWQLPVRNPVWGGYYVDPGHPEWVEQVRTRAVAAAEKGFSGLLLDTLETPPILARFPHALLELVRTLRHALPSSYLLANRAYPFLNDLTLLVDGFLFEAFSTTWEGGYSAFRGRELLENSARLRTIQATGRHVYALDYSDRPDLTAFAVARARNLEIPVQVTDRTVTGLPE